MSPFAFISITLVVAGIFPLTIKSQEDEIMVYYDIVEEQTNVSHVGNLYEDAQLTEEFDAADLAAISLQFLSDSEFWKGYFSVQSGTGKKDLLMSN